MSKPEQHGDSQGNASPDEKGRPVVLPHHTHDFIFEPVRREVVSSKYMGDLKTNHYRLVVANKEEWSKLLFHCCEGLEQSKILIKAETLFSGDDGPIYNDVGYSLGDNWTIAGLNNLRLQDVQSRIFEIVKDTQAEVWWMLGMSVRNFMKSVPDEIKECQTTL